MMNRRQLVCVASLVLALASPSYAARKPPRPTVLVCSNAHDDQGFILTAAGSGERLSIQENTSNGPIQLAVVSCRTVPQALRTPGSVEMKMVKFCTNRGPQQHQTQIFDVTISEGGSFFHRTADLVINGKVVAEDMFCSLAPSE